MMPDPNSHYEWPWHKEPEIHRVYLYEVTAEEEYMRQQGIRYREMIISALESERESTKSRIVRIILGLFIWILRHKRTDWSIRLK